MLEHIEKAEAEINKAIASLLPMKKMTQLESYILGHLRPIAYVLEKARDAIQKTQALSKTPAPARKEQDPEQQ